MMFTAIWPTARDTVGPPRSFSSCAVNWAIWKTHSVIFLQNWKASTNRSGSRLRTSPKVNKWNLSHIILATEPLLAWYLYNTIIHLLHFYRRRATDSNINDCILFDFFYGKWDSIVACIPNTVFHGFRDFHLTWEELSRDASLVWSSNLLACSSCAFWPSVVSAVGVWIVPLQEVQVITILWIIWLCLSVVRQSFSNYGASLQHSIWSNFKHKTMWRDVNYTLLSHIL